MSRQFSARNRVVQHHADSQHKGQQGLTLLMVLMLGTVLTAGVSGLMARQIMSRRLSAKESYQQLAEAAANNGLNRILGRLNNADPAENRGFLFNLDNRENINEANNGFHWERLNTDQPPEFSEICQDSSIGLPAHPNQNSDSVWPTTEVPLQAQDSPSLRNDGVGTIASFYRLRGYSSPGTSGHADSGEAKFIIEGIVRREGAPEDSFLARSRLERSLYIQSWVDISRSQDWGVLAAHHLELGPVQLNGPGLVLWHRSKEQAGTVLGNCNSSNLVRQVGGDARNTINLASRIWPVVDQEQPPGTIFRTTHSRDGFPGRPGEIRVWRIDDDNLLQSGCRNRVVCHRPGEGTAYSRPTDLQITRRRTRVNGRQQTTATIRLRENDICTGQTGDCHVYLDRLNLSRSRLLIENSTRPVVLHLLGSVNNQAGEESAITLGSEAQICGVDVNSNQCNHRPERLIITTESAQVPEGCASRNQAITLSGESLPAAWILMRQGTVSLESDTVLRGMIWSHSFCANNHRLSLTAQSSDSVDSSLVAQASELWDWGSKGFAGYGRTITRGVRGTSLDQFQRF